MKRPARPGRSPGAAIRATAAAALPALLLPALASCGGGSPAAATGPGSGPPATGAVEVTTSTSGAEPDPDGYTVEVDEAGERRTIGVEDTVVVGELEEGEHAVRLSNLAPNCAVLEGGNPRSVAVPAGDTAAAAFPVGCDGRSAVEVTVSAVAGGLDPDGFRVALDGGEPRTVGPDATEVFDAVASGGHTVELSGVDDPCSLAGAASRDVDAAPGDTAAVTYEVTCRLLDRIVFTSTRGESTGIHVVAADGSGTVGRITAEDVDGFHPSVAPDGARIAFTSARDGDPDVYVVEADGSNPRQRTDEPGFDGHPAWSPDGDRIAFTSERDGTKQDVYVMDADGANVTRLTAGPEDDLDPSWSPDGTRLAFTSERAGPDEIFVMRSDGSDTPERLTENGAGAAAWSPDGTWIAFGSGRDGDAEVYVICANGALPAERRTDHDASDQDPSWSPDGTRIAFASGRNGGSDLFVMGADGSDPSSVTSDPEGDAAPAWSPASSSGPAPPPGTSECDVAAP